MNRRKNHINTFLLFIAFMLLRIMNSYGQSVNISIHTDRDIYFINEHIWYKAYTSNHYNGAIYIDLINEDGNNIINQELKVINGIAHGEIGLNSYDRLKPGNYLIKAYLGETSTQAYYKSIQIYDSQIKPKTLPTKKLNVDFFPEGGNVVNGHIHKVAFKVVDNYNKLIDCKGKIVNNLGDTISSITTTSPGIGLFYIKPTEGETYYLYIEDSLKFDITIPRKDYLLTVIEQEKQFNAVIKKAGKIPSFTLKVFHEGQVQYEEHLEASNDSIITLVPKNVLPDGVSYLYIQDTSGNEILYRPIFNQNKRPPILTIDNLGSNYLPREDVNLQLKLSDYSGEPLGGRFSISVTSIEPNQYQNIITDWLLPNYTPYAATTYGHQGSVNKKNVDALLLTYKRDPDGYVINNTKNSPGSLEGIVKVKSTGKHAINKIVEASVLGKKPSYYQVRSDLDGHFIIKDIKDHTHKDIIIQSPDTSLVVELFHNIIENIKMPYPYPLLDIESFKTLSQKNQLQQSIMQSYNINSSDETAIKQKDSIITYKKIHERAESIIELGKYVRFPTMPEIFREIVPGVRLKNKKGQYDVRVLDLETKLYYKKSPLFLLDGVPVHDTETIMGLSTKNLKTIEVIHNKRKGVAQFGILGYNGVVAIYTDKKNYFEKEELLPGMQKAKIEGYHQSKTFDTKARNNPRAPRLHPTVYWNPNIEVNGNGKTPIAYQQNDELGKMYISIEGITSNGIPLSKTFQYNVTFK